MQCIGHLYSTKAPAVEPKFDIAGFPWFRESVKVRSGFAFVFEGRSSFEFPTGTIIAKFSRLTKSFEERCLETFIIGSRRMGRGKLTLSESEWEGTAMARKKLKRKELAQIESNIADLATDPVMEVLTCEDGAEELVQAHLAIGVDMLHAVVTMSFASIFLGAQESGELPPMDSGTADYLRRATRILGLHDVSAALDVGFPAALEAFRLAPIGLDDTARKNAKAMDLLLG